MHHLPHRLHPIQQESWFQSFGWNILGYALIILPCVFFIKMVRASNFYERDGKTFVYIFHLLIVYQFKCFK